MHKEISVEEFVELLGEYSSKHGFGDGDDMAAIEAAEENRSRIIETVNRIFGILWIPFEAYCLDAETSHNPVRIGVREKRHSNEEEDVAS